MNNLKQVSTTKITLLKIFCLFMAWRSGLFLIGLLAPNFLPYDPSFPYADAILATRDLPQWLFSWSGFDGVHYLTIIEKGYFGTGLIQAFFPLFPISISLLKNIIPIDPLLLSLLISNILAFSLFSAWYFFLKQEFDNKIAWTGLLVLVTFPTSFFFGAVYTESLFLLLVVACFWAARSKKWLIASALVALASATRVVGVLLIPALVIELWHQQLPEKFLKPPQNLRQTWVFLTNLVSKDTTLKVISKQKINLGWILLGSVGLLSYMWYLFQRFGDPIYFFHVQSEFGGGRQEDIILFPQVVWRYLKILLTYDSSTLGYYAIIQEFLVSILTLLGLFWSLKKIRFSLVFFALTAFFVPTLTGTFSSMPRYVLTSLPLFIIISTKLNSHKFSKVIWLTLSTFLLIFNTILFIQGYWVA
jgi:hypothetical protein